MANKSGYDWEILCTNRALCSAGWWMTFWAGAVNALTSFSVVFLRTTHMTGRVTDQAKYLLTDPAMALLVSLAILFFVMGAFSGAKALNQWSFTVCLLLPALTLLTAAVLVYAGVSSSGPQGLESGRFVLAALLPFGAGWQNSITSKGRLGRTTHLSGELTDLGIALAAGEWTRAGYLFIKYLGFMAGGMAGYLGSRYSPALMLAILSAGYASTVMVFHLKNAWSAQSVPSNVVAFSGQGTVETKSNMVL